MFRMESFEGTVSDPFDGHRLMQLLDSALLQVAMEALSPAASFKVEIRQDKSDECLTMGGLLLRFFMVGFIGLPLQFN